MKLKTEAEAMAKTCPLMQVPCHGSRCMFWDWKIQEFSRKTELWSKSKGIKVNSAFSDDAEYRVVAGEPNEPPPALGHCSQATKDRTSFYYGGDST